MQKQKKYAGVFDTQVGCLIIRVKVIKFQPYWHGVMYYKDGTGAPPEPPEVEEADLFFVDRDGKEIPVPDMICDILFNDGNWYETICSKCQEIHDEREAAAERERDKLMMDEPL